MSISRCKILLELSLKVTLIFIKFFIKKKPTEAAEIQHLQQI